MSIVFSPIGLSLIHIWYYNVYSATVIHPFEMAVKELMLGIVLIVFAAIVLIIIINILINKTIKQQEKYDQMRNNFTSGVAHEFKTPLALIKSYTETVSYTHLPHFFLYKVRIVAAITEACV